MIDMTEHKKKRNFKCTKCKKEFLTKREIERHNRREKMNLNLGVISAGALLRKRANFGTI
jgi:hypothetical protein